MTIYAIGGASSGGKSTVARHLHDTGDYGDLVHLDDLHPSTLEDQDHDWTAPPDHLLARLFADTASRHPIVRAELARYRTTARSALIEGEGIEPAELADATDVRVVYVIEDDPDRLRHTLSTRTGADRFLALSPPEQAGVVEMNRRYGQWLRAEAERHAQPWTPSHPWSTLPTRIRAAWET